MICGRTFWDTKIEISSKTQLKRNRMEEIERYEGNIRSLPNEAICHILRIMVTERSLTISNVNRECHLSDWQQQWHCPSLLDDISKQWSTHIRHAFFHIQAITFLWFQCIGRRRSNSLRIRYLFPATACVIKPIRLFDCYAFRILPSLADSLSKATSNV